VGCGDNNRADRDEPVEDPGLLCFER
jgi:hypothetical protein